MTRTLVERELTAEGPRRGVGNQRERRSVAVNLGELPLTWPHARGHLSDRQLDAGERFRADWERAQLTPSVTMSWNPVRHRGGAGDLTPGERQLAARARFDGAVAGLADVLWRVACAGESLPVAEKALAWPVRSGKLVLRLALDRVAEFYRLG